MTEPRPCAHGKACIFFIQQIVLSICSEVSSFVDAGKASEQAKFFVFMKLIFQRRGREQLSNRQVYI